LIGACGSKGIDGARNPGAQFTDRTRCQYPRNLRQIDLNPLRIALFGVIPSLLQLMKEPFQVLLFEDTPDDEALAIRALKSVGAPLFVRVARDGVEALDVLGLSGATDEEAPSLPHLVISDLKMPRMSGAEVLARARKHRQFSEVPFVIFSSSDEPGDIQRCMDLGASAYCIKPVDYTSFVDCVKAIASRWLLGRDDEEADADCILETATGT
jgi:two-component system response regulator